MYKGKDPKGNFCLQDKETCACGHGIGSVEACLTFKCQHVHLAKISDVHTSMKCCNSFPRDTFQVQQSSMKMAGVSPAHLCGCSPSVLYSHLAISGEHCWVQAEVMQDCISSSSWGCQWWDLVNECVLDPSKFQHFKHSFVMLPCLPSLPVMDNFSFEGR